MPADRRRPPQGSLGFNLIELLMALAIASVIFMSMTVLYTYQARTLQIQQGMLTTYREARFALEHLRRDLMSLGSNTTPNSEIDGLVCPKPTTTLRVLTAQKKNGYRYAATLNPNIESQGLTLFGGLDIHTRFRVAAIDGAKVTLQNVDLPASEPLWVEVFTTDRYLRLSSPDGRSMFYPIESTSFPNKTVTLLSSPPRLAGKQRCGYQGTGWGMWADVQGFIRYRVVADTRPGAPVDLNGTPTRGLLVRERLATDGKTMRSQLVIAENAIELSLRDAVADIDPAGYRINLVNYALPGQFIGTSPFDLGVGLTASPERLRSITVAVSLRTEVPDRDLVHAPRTSTFGPIRTYRLDKDRPTTCRVVTMAQRISLPALIARNL